MEGGQEEEYSSGRVLAIASHVVSGYVGNTVTTFVLQLLGLETATLNTVQYSNHAGYRRLEGFRTSARQISDLFGGLELNGLDGFDMLLTGYVPGELELRAVGEIAKEVKKKRKKKINNNYGQCFFWLLDPVMGDQGRLYVSEGVLPVYKSLVPHADLIVPNQFEAELLCGVTVDSIASLSTAIDALHRLYSVPHVVITSVTVPSAATSTSSTTTTTEEEEEKTMFCAGSTIVASSGASRKFVVDVPLIDGFYSGTGDLFAALTLARLREGSAAAGLLPREGWVPDDAVPPLDLPLAKAVEKVLGSMHCVLERTRNARDVELAAAAAAGSARDHRAVTKASELRLVQSQKELLRPVVICSARILE